MSAGAWFRSFFPGKPTFLEKDVPDLTNKTAIVTGANTGVGKEIARILYAKNANVYVLARSEDKALQAISDIKASVPRSSGQLHFLHLDLADLPSVRASAQSFLAREARLHLLFHNAGVAFGPRGRRTKQGHEICIGTNCVGPHLLTTLLAPVMRDTVPDSAPGSVRIVWTSSSGAMSPDPTTLIQDLKREPDEWASHVAYATSKLGNYLQSAEWARRVKKDGVVSVSLNPGNLDSELARELPALVQFLMRRMIVYPAVYGAYTTLWAATSPEVNLESTTRFVGPWGKFVEHDLPKKLIDAAKTKSEGGTGVADEFRDWVDEQIKGYL